MRVQENEPFVGHSYSGVVIGAFILWVSWLFFNGGSTLTIYAERQANTPKIVMNTIISGASGGLVSCVLKPMCTLRKEKGRRKYDVGALSNGLLAGLVGITGACADVDPWSAFVIGVISAFFYTAGCKANKALGVDDPIEASSVHGFCGIWGLIAVGIFSKTQGLISSSPDKGKFIAV